MHMFAKIDLKVLNNFPILTVNYHLFDEFLPIKTSKTPAEALRKQYRVSGNVAASIIFPEPL